MYTSLEDVRRDYGLGYVVMPTTGGGSANPCADTFFRMTHPGQCATAPTSTVYPTKTLPTISSPPPDSYTPPPAITPPPPAPYTPPETYQPPAPQQPEQEIATESPVSSIAPELLVLPGGGGGGSTTVTIDPADVYFPDGEEPTAERGFGFVEAALAVTVGWILRESFKRSRRGR